MKISLQSLYNKILINPKGSCFLFTRYPILSIKFTINPLTTNVPNHIKNSQLTGTANQLTGFYIWGMLVVNGLRNDYDNALTFCDSDNGCF